MDINERIRILAISGSLRRASSNSYAHGVPGVLKNALDWIVGSGELIDKPVAIVNASSRATRAWASITIPLQGRPPAMDGVEGAELSRALAALVAATRLAHAI